MLNAVMQRLQGMRQGAPVSATPTVVPQMNMGAPAVAPATNTVAPAVAPTEPTAGAAGGMSSQNRLAMLKNMIMRRIAQRMQSPEMMAQMPQQAGQNQGYLANMILGRPVSQVMGGQIAPQAMTPGYVAPTAPTTASGMFSSAPTAPTAGPTAGAANVGASSVRPSITSDITQSGEGGQTIQSTGSLAFAPGRAQFRR